MGGDTRRQLDERRFAAIDAREKERATKDAESTKKKRNRRGAMYLCMKNHENFEMPKSPDMIAGLASIAAAEYAIACAVALISPKQEVGESNEMECVDIIDILENELLPEILRSL